MKNKRKTAFLIVFAVVSCVFSRTALCQIPQGWEIIEIFPAGTEYYCGPPDINDRGQIVFHRRLWPSRTEMEILLYDKGALKERTADHIYDSFPRINNHGQMVWQRDLNPDPTIENVGIVHWNGEELIVISDEPYYEGDADLRAYPSRAW